MGNLIYIPGDLAHHSSDQFLFRNTARNKQKGTKEGDGMQHFYVNYNALKQIGILDIILPTSSHHMVPSRGGAVSFKVCSSLGKTTVCVIPFLSCVSQGCLCLLTALTPAPPMSGPSALRFATN